MVAITYECPNCYQHSGHAENCPSWYNTEPPAPRAGEREQSRLFSRYTFAVVTGRYKILDSRSDEPARITQIATADGEDEARLIIQALNQHATLIEQRERLLQAARFALSTPGLIRGRDSLQRIVDEVLATIEQQTEVKSNTSGEAGR